MSLSVLQLLPMPGDSMSATVLMCLYCVYELLALQLIFQNVILLHDKARRRDLWLCRKLNHMCRAPLHLFVYLNEGMSNEPLVSYWLGCLKEMWLDLCVRTVSYVDCFVHVLFSWFKCMPSFSIKSTQVLVQAAPALGTDQTTTDNSPMFLTDVSCDAKSCILFLL